MRKCDQARSAHDACRRHRKESRKRKRTMQLAQQTEARENRKRRKREFQVHRVSVMEEVTPEMPALEILIPSRRLLPVAVPLEILVTGLPWEVAQRVALLLGG